ncbi:MAG: glutamate--cysteine ligase [Actinomycetes bacterium]|jgi:hypothetical protein|nr:glutamate--cysteine ligase [Actinomycetes bacterium]
MLEPDRFRFGIEHEYGIIDAEGRWRDFTNATFEEYTRVIDALPLIASDAQTLRTGDLGIKAKRWYIEGFERFSDTGEYLRTIPKGFEIRTPICASLDAAVDTLIADFARWQTAAAPYGYHAARCSLNPLQTEYVCDPPLNDWEIVDRATPEEQTAHIHMLTYGPDVSFSHPDCDLDACYDIACKLTYYSPWIVPFSFTSPFYGGSLWGGYSRRTYYRTGPRPSVLMFTDRTDRIIPSFPTLMDTARIPAEAGRIEFKAFDCPRQLDAFRALGALLLGVVLDDSLNGRATVPHAATHRLAAEYAFDDPDIREGAATVLAAARAALPLGWARELDPLDDMLAQRRTPAHDMIRIYRETGDILSAIA